MGKFTIGDKVIRKSTRGGEFEGTVVAVVHKGDMPFEPGPSLANVLLPPYNDLEKKHDCSLLINSSAVKPRDDESYLILGKSAMGPPRIFWPYTAMLKPFEKPAGDYTYITPSNPGCIVIRIEAVIPGDTSACSIEEGVDEAIERLRKLGNALEMRPRRMITEDFDAACRILDKRAIE